MSSSFQTAAATDAATAGKVSSSSAAASNEIEKILVDIRNQLILALQQQGQHVEQASSWKQSMLAALKEASSNKPQVVMDILAPLLFQGETSNSNNDDDEKKKKSLMSGSEALQVLRFLVSSSDEESTTYYLKPASRAVKRQALGLMEGRVVVVVHPSDNNNSSTVVCSPELLHTMVAQLSGFDVETSANATEAIVACCRHFSSASSTFIESALAAVTDSWKAAMNEAQTGTGSNNNNNNRAAASTTCVRCATTVTEILCAMLADDSTMRSAISVGAMSLFLDMLQDDSDPLVQMSMLDLLEKFIGTRPIVGHERTMWLFQQQPPGVIRPILKMAGGMEDNDDDNDNDPDPILGGAALRIVAALCKLAHDRQEQDGTTSFGDLLEGRMTISGEGGGGGESVGGDSSSNILTGFYRSLHKFAESSGGEMDRLAFINAVSSFASASTAALDLVLKDTVIRQAWLNLAVAQPRLKSVILMSVAMVMNPPIAVDANGDSSSPSSSTTMMTTTTPRADADNDNDNDDTGAKTKNRSATMKLYSSLGQVNHDQDPTTLLISMTRSTLVETRLGAYALFEAVAKLPTGGQVLFSNADFLDFLLSRDQERENTLEGRQGKFAIVQAIQQSQVMGLLAPEIVQRIESYIKQGPHYVQARSWELATEQ